MGFFNFIKKKSKPTLREDITKSYEWIFKALKSSNYSVDFSIESLNEIDRFFDEQSDAGRPKIGGLLSQDTGMRLFALGAYVGEVLRREFDGEWVTDDNDPDGEINIEVQFKKGVIIWPAQRVMKRMNNGKVDGIYAFACALNSQVDSTNKG